MIIKNRKNRNGFDINIGGIRIGDTVFKDNEAFKVVGFETISYDNSILLNGYSKSNYSIKELIDIETEDINKAQFWNIIYDDDGKHNLDYSLWVPRDEVKTFEELDFTITKDTLKGLKKLYKGDQCSSIPCNVCPLKISGIACIKIIDLSSDEAKSKIKVLIQKFKKYLKEENNGRNC